MDIHLLIIPHSHLVHLVTKNELIMIKALQLIIELYFKEIKRLNICFRKKKFLRYKMHYSKLNHNKLKNYLIPTSVNYFVFLTLFRKYSALKILEMKVQGSSAWRLKANS